LYLSYLGRYKITKYKARTTNDITSKILMSPRIFRWFRPQLRVSFDHTMHRLTDYGIQLNKRVFRNGQLTVSFERQEISKSYQIMGTLKFWSGFADFTSRMIYIDDNVSMSQIQKGSILYDNTSHRVRFSRRSGVGYGSAVIRPFLDGNYNGILDQNEEYMPGLRANIKGGRQDNSNNNQRFYYYDGLRAYDDYLVQIDQYSINDPSLKPTHENYNVIFNPNTVTSIDVPLVTAAEVSGIVERQLTNGIVGVGGIKIILVNISRETVTEITAFSNGEYMYFGLLPGFYRAYIDPQQLLKFKYESEPKSIEFKVDPANDGLSVENINFLLIPKPESEIIPESTQ
jgi:hypothetical protein